MQHGSRSLSWREAVAAGWIFLALATVYCYPLGWDAAPFEGDGDSTLAYLPYLQRCFQPLTEAVAGPWDPTVFTGLPESHAPCSRYYLPAVLLHSLFVPAQAMALLVVVHHAWGGLGAYLLLRGSGFRRRSSWLGAVLFAFGGFLVAHRGHVFMAVTASWLPWVLWALERFRTQGRYLWVAVAATALGLQGLAGHLHMIALGGTVWVTYLVYFAAAGPGGRLTRTRFAAGVLLCCVVGACVSLPQTLPLMEVASWSMYREASADFVAEGEVKLYMLLGLFGPGLLGGFGLPAARGYWGFGEHGMFYGQVGLILAAAGLLGWVLHFRKRTDAPAGGQGAVLPGPRLVGFWLVLLAETFLLMSNKTFGLNHLLVHVPIYKSFHAPGRHVLVLGLALGWFAALGVEQLLVAPVGLRRKLIARLGWAVLAAAAGAAGVILFTPFWDGLRSWSHAGYWVPLVSACLVVAALALATRGDRWRWASLLLPALAFVELWLHIGSYGITPSPAPALARPEAFPPAVQWLRARSEDGVPPRCLFRTESWDVDGRPRQMPGGIPSCWGLSSLSYYSQSAPISLAGLLDLSRHGAADFPAVLATRQGLNAAGGRYIVSRQPLPEVSPGLGYRVATLGALDWSASHPSAEPGAQCAFTAGFPEAKAESVFPRRYLMTGIVHGSAQHPVTVQVVRSFMARDETLALAEVAPVQSARPATFAFLVDLGNNFAHNKIRVLSPGGGGLPLAGLEVWRLTPQAVRLAGDLGPAALAARLAATTSQPYPLVAKFPGGVKVYENPQARSLVTMVREVRPAGGETDAVQQVLSGGHDPREVAYVASAQAASRRLAGGTARVKRYRGGEIDIETEAAGDGFLVLAVTRTRGWSATVDGVPVAIESVDGPLMGIPLPPGSHQVRFCFSPVLVWLGALLGSFALGGLWLAIAVGHALARRRARAGQEILQLVTGGVSSGEDPPARPAKAG